MKDLATPEKEVYKPPEKANLIVTRDIKRKYIFLDPQPENQPHQFTIIFLHGLGNSAEGLVGIFEDETNGLTNKRCRVVLPTAPRCKVSIQGGYEMNSWFDILPNYNKP